MLVYFLSANVPEMIPFLAVIVLGYPLPLSLIMVLCLDMGSNANLSFCLIREEAECDIMMRPPYNLSRDFSEKKIFCTSYSINGVFITLGAFLTYFTIMYNFGITPSELGRLGVMHGFHPEPSDVFSPNDPFMGMTNPKFISYCYNCWQGGECDVQKLDSSLYDRYPDWLYTDDRSDDLRLWYLTCSNDGGIRPAFRMESCGVRKISRVFRSSYLLYY